MMNTRSIFAVSLILCTVIQKGASLNFSPRFGAKFRVSMESAIRTHKIHALKMQLERCRLRCESLAKDIEPAETVERKTILAHQWDQTIKEIGATQAALTLLERQEKKSSKPC